MELQGLNKTLIITFFTIASSSVFSQNIFNKKTSLPVVNIEKISGEYQEGEIVVFKANPKFLNEPLNIYWRLMINGKNFSLKSGNKFTTPKLIPGKANLIVSAVDNNKKDAKNNFEFQIQAKPKSTITSDLNIKKQQEEILEIKIPKAPYVYISGPSFVKPSDDFIILKPSVISDSKNIKYFWTQVNTIKSDYFINSDHQLVLNSRIPGEYNFKIKVVDEFGQYSEALHTININAVSKPEITIRNGIYNVIQLPKDSITVFADANVANGHIISFKWVQIDGPQQRINNANVYSLSLNNLKFGDYTFNVTVKDNFGQEETTRVYISVKRELLVQSNNSQQIDNSTSVSNAPKLKGGAGNALVNILLPGLGHYYVSGNYLGEERKKASFLVTFAYIGAASGAIYYKLKADAEYAKYQDMAKFRDIQLDPVGNVIGVRGMLAANADQVYSNANQYNNTYKTFLIAGGAIVLTDFIYTIIKGTKNSREHKSAYNLSSIMIVPVPGTSGYKASVVFGF